MDKYNGLVRQDVAYVTKNNDHHIVDVLTQEEKKELILDVAKNWNEFLDAIS